MTGRAFKKLGLRRQEIVVATKVFSPMGESPNEKGTSKKHVKHAIEASLQRSVWTTSTFIKTIGTTKPRR